MYVWLHKFSPVHLVLATTLLCSLNISADESTNNTIAPGKVVSLSYTLRLPDGKAIGSNVDTYPIKYRQGDGKLLPALEAAVVGLAAGDEKSVTLAPEDAYGPVDPAAIREVPIEQVPPEARKAGAVFSTPGYSGLIRVTEIKEDMAILNLNHPLAGKILTFDIKILSVE
ncbi:MAG: peptidylprolyl isomerase [Gammaproteobacteria bacterium]|jgi:FKBP-type peptidyl-prolyl cis-trans isomerase 2|nr:peptidylprolyl isomerase [Gammaproteobacteria bacterium]MDP6615635.1 peptidylprolyl isomerase [Gammaproteobacteria bacterium]MDP6696082.1 peptidylprolyl isomerase [Gammaproteobacteria bacterium]